MPDSIETARSKCARFYRADLHVHSPLSRDWRNTSGNSLFDSVSSIREIDDKHLEAYLGKLKEANLQIVAITDHMKYSFGVALAEYALRHGEDILILPGIEISVRFQQPLLRDYRIHVLAVFPPDVGHANIERIFPPGFPDEDRRNGTEEVDFADIDGLVDKVRDLEGKTIASHIYSTNGIRSAYTKQAQLILKPISGHPEHAEIYERVGEAIKDELFKFDCLQINKGTDPIHFKDESSQLFIPLIIASDSHEVGNFGNDDDLTFMKLGELNTSSFYEALKFPDTRIRFKSSLPDSRPPRLRGMRIVGQEGNAQSFFKNLTVGFSDNLTCIIGPRGSGKSAMIDAIRYAMGYNRSLHEIERVRKQVEDRQEHTLKASRIELLYEKADSVQHRIVATYDTREVYNTTVFDLEDNALNVVDVEASSEYPLNLYGWNELELLGENPKSQRESLDKFIKEVLQLKSDRKGLYQVLAGKSEECITQLNKLEAYFDPSYQKDSFVRLKEFEAEYAKLNTEEMAAVFTKLDDLGLKLTFLMGLQERIETASKNLSLIGEVEYKDLLGECGEASEWCSKFVDERLKLISSNDEVLKAKNGLVGLMKGLLDIIEAEEKRLREDHNEASKEIRLAIGEEQSITADLRNNAKRRMEKAQSQFADYERDLEEFERLMEERKSILKNIKDVNLRVFAKRSSEVDTIKSKIDLVNDEDFQIGLKILQEKDRSEFLAGLEKNEMGFHFEGQWRKRRIAELISNRLTPICFGEVILDNASEALINSFDDYVLDKEYAEGFVANNLPYDNLQDLEIRRYDKPKLVRILSIQQIPFDDHFFIELNGKPIQYCSPGQRCSAMLPLVTLTSDAPIVIDQPEDNLDNRLVSKAIYRILTKLKEFRQIIVATHNPNILVSGDSEQVVVLNHVGQVETSGSIDGRDIIQNVVDLMEGGKEAFEKRRSKYGDLLR